MCGLAVLHSRLQPKSDGVRIDFFEYVSVLLSFPVFELSKLLFKFMFFLQQRHLRCLGRQCVLMGGIDLSVQFEGFLSALSRPDEIQNRLREINRRLEAAS